MRVADSVLSKGYLNDINKAKTNLLKLQSQLTNNAKIQKPSDSPAAASRLIRLSNNINLTNTFTENVQNSTAFVKQTSLTMESIQNEIANVLTKITEANNAANKQNLSMFADQIDSTITTIMNLANSEFDGKFIFAGTDFSAQPFGYSADNKSIEVKASDISGDHNVKISKNISQKINITGAELFGTTLFERGNFNSSDAVGTLISDQSNVYDALGNEYTLKLNYTKSAQSNYTLQYDIVDSGGTSILSSTPPTINLELDADTGLLKTVDGKTNKLIHIKDSSVKIDFNLDVSGLKESTQTPTLTVTANQKQDIFNLLISIRDNMRNGIAPTTEQEDAVTNFNKRILDKLAQIGNVENQLLNTKDLLAQQNSILSERVAQEQEIDYAKMSIEVQNQDYLLQLAYKLSSIILPKSLLDFL